MGHVRPIENIGQNGEKSDLTSLEITYGGLESPFNGVHLGPPPAYIDPKCFADSNNFFVINNKLVLMSLEPFSFPVLWSGTAGVVLLKFGTFYNSIYGQLNYAIGYNAVDKVTNPKNTKFTFYITAWNYDGSGNTVIVDNEVLSVTLYNSETLGTQASIVLPAIASNVSNSTPATTPAVVSSIVTDYPDGAVITVNLSSGGTGYVANQSLVIYQGTNQSGSLIIDTVDGSGAILTQHVDNGGFNYQVPGGSHGPVTLTINPESPSTCVLTIVGPAGTNTYSVTSYSNSSAASIVALMVTAINTTPDPNVIAQASPDGFSLQLSANSTNAIGTAGNAITVQDSSANADVTKAPPIYFPCVSVDNLTGGTDPATANVISTFKDASVVDVGGTLYIANIGPFILKYSGPNTFDISSAYTGVRVLRKFAGSLIGVGVIPQLGTLVQNSDMIFAWSAANNLDEWNPLDSNGNVTGAGFEQLADIGEALNGLVVTNNVAYIIRSEGLSYATALGSGMNPFQIAHIGLGHTGEGCQVPSLIAQYDQTGAYVGNTNIFQLSSSIGAIGDKVKSFLIPLLTQTQIVLKTLIFPAVNDGGDSYSLLAIAIGQYLFFYNTANQTWMIFYLNIQNTVSRVVYDVLFLGKSGIGFNQFPLVIAQQTGTAAPAVNYLVESIPSVNTVETKPSYVTFPQEEVLFGRDVTIDALYVSLWANLIDNITIEFLFNGVHFAFLVLSAGAPLNTLNGTPTEFQVFPDNLSGTTGVFTSHSPQLQVSVRSPVTTHLNQLRFAKIQEYASFDQRQRPV